VVTGSILYIYTSRETADYFIRYTNQLDNVKLKLILPEQEEVIYDKQNEWAWSRQEDKEYYKLHSAINQFNNTHCPLCSSTHRNSSPMKTKMSWSVFPTFEAKLNTLALFFQVSHKPIMDHTYHTQ